MQPPPQLQYVRLLREQDRVIIVIFTCARQQLDLHIQKPKPFRFAGKIAERHTNMGVIAPLFLIPHELLHIPQGIRDAVPAQSPNDERLRPIDPGQGLICTRSSMMP